MICAALVAAVALAIFVYQDGIHRCQDGDRYTSGERQPTPFHRRFCGWPPRLLMLLTWAGFVVVSATLGGWKQSLMFATLPGVWFCAVNPTTVDGPSMALAWLSALAWQAGHPYLAVLLSCVSGCIHERGPAFAAIYAWHWLPLVGLVVPLLVGLRTPAKPNHLSDELADRLVGHGTIGAVAAHRPYVDLLSATGLVWSLRVVAPLAAWLGVDARAWAALGVTYASRIIGTDTSRYLMWGAPALLAHMHDVPLWAVALHVCTFRRASQ